MQPLFWNALPVNEKWWYFEEKSTRKKEEGRKIRGKKKNKEKSKWDLGESWDWDEGFWLKFTIILNCELCVGLIL